MADSDVTFSNEEGWLAPPKSREATHTTDKADELEQRRRRLAAEAAIAPDEKLGDLDDSGDVSTPTRFRILKKELGDFDAPDANGNPQRVGQWNGLVGAAKNIRNVLDPTSPTRFVSVGPAPAPAPATEPVTGPKEEGGKSALELALESRPNESVVAGAGAAGQLSAILTGGGFKAAQVGESTDITAARKLDDNSRAAVLNAQARFRSASESARDVRTKQIVADTAAEEKRMASLQTAGTDITALNRETKTKQEAFRVDPDRLFGQGAGRAGTTFGLALANVVSNVGEAMQGKAGTNAILTLVKDRVVQDIELQENDYRRMMQGFQVRRNGLMDSIQYIGDERKGAEALAKQQGLAYADQLDAIAAKVGLTDAKFAYPFNQAAVELRTKFGQLEQQRQEFNVGAINRASQQQSSQAFSARQFNLESERVKAQYLETARLLSTQVPPLDKVRADTIMDDASKMHLNEQYTLMGRLRALATDPAAVKEIAGLAGKLASAVGRDGTAGTFSTWAATQATSTLSPVQQQMLDLMREYRGLKETGLGGKAITGMEDFLFNPFGDATPANLDRKLTNVQKSLISERNAQFLRSNFVPDSNAGRFLAAGLSSLVPDIQRTTPNPVPQPTAKVSP